jgi:hypothetical protein
MQHDQRRALAVDFIVELDAIDGDAVVLVGVLIGVSPSV